MKIIKYLIAGGFNWYRKVARSGDNTFINTILDLSVVYSANLITIINYVNYYIIELTITPNAFIGIMVITSSLMFIISYRYAKNQEEDILKLWSSLTKRQQNLVTILSFVYSLLSIIFTVQSIYLYK